MVMKDIVLERQQVAFPVLVQVGDIGDNWFYISTNDEGLIYRLISRNSLHTFPFLYLILISDENENEERPG